MKVFLSWSGARSFQVAKALRDWLPTVVQAAEPWLSEEDIAKGARWGHDLGDQLGATKAGVICLTPENVEAPWLLFEAGALSKEVTGTLVCPYLYGLKPTDVTGPLAQFQAAVADRSGTQQLVRTIHGACEGKKITADQLNLVFARLWPELDKQLSALTNVPGDDTPRRSERDLLEEILAHVRSLTDFGPKRSELGIVIPAKTSQLLVRPRFTHDPNEGGTLVEWEYAEIVSKEPKKPADSPPRGSGKHDERSPD